MPIAVDGSVYDDEVAYTAKVLGIQLPTHEEAPGSSQTQEATQVPSSENNAPAGNVEGVRPLPERYQTWPERMVRGVVSGAVSAMTLPGDVLSGKVQPGSPQEIERAMDLAGLMVTGPAPVASRMADGTLGSFAGVKSKTIDFSKMEKAYSMYTEGKSIDNIWEKTGFFQGADGRWRYEIPDNTSTLKDTGFNRSILENNPNAGGESTPVVSVNPNGAKLSEALDHPELFEAYPHLKDINVQPLPKSISNTDRNVIGQMSGDTLYLKDELDPGFAKSVMLHEIQHAVQDYEGFARGGSSTAFASPKLKEAESFFTKVKADTEKELMETKGWSKTDLDRTKFIIRNEDTLNDALQNHLNLFKKKHPDAYERLSNIVKSEDLLKAESKEQFDQYQRLMGEVEARNVQRRMDFNDINRLYMPPDTTESIPRSKQIRR